MLRNWFGNTNGVPYTACAGEMFESSRGCERRPSSTQGSSAAQEALVPRVAQGILEAAVEALDHAIALWMLACGWPVLNLK
jgi:hypothetical protein